MRERGARTDHYFVDEPAIGSATKVLTVGFVDPPLRLTTDRGVFSYGRLDPGTAFLLKQAPPPPATGHFADLGCGYGPIALAMARRSPAARVIAVDVNARARALCAANAAANGISNVETSAPDDIDLAVSFDLIWSNPPIHIGKAALHPLLTEWLRRLAPAATAILVVHKHLGSDSLQRWLNDQGWPTDRLTSSRGYRLLRVRAGS